jgi:hypothetical protein
MFLRGVKILVGVFLMGCAGLAHLKEFAHSTANLRALLSEHNAFEVVLALSLWWIPALVAEAVCLFVGLFVIVRAVEGRRKGASPPSV